MTLQYYIGGKVTGLEADVKPLGAPEFTTFIETDTQREFILIAGVYQQIPSEPLVNDLALKAYWKFDEISPGPIINQSQSAVDLGSAADIAMTGGTFGETGILAGGSAVLFDGVDDFGEAGASLSQWNFMHNVGATMTVAFWLNLSSVGADDSEVFDTSNQGAGVGILCRVLQQANRFQFNIKAPANVVNFESNIIPGTGYEFYTVTWDDNIGTDQLKIKINDGAPFLATKVGTPTNNDANNSMIIARQGTASNLFLNGTLDETSIWDRVLSDAEITELFNNDFGQAIY